MNASGDFQKKRKAFTLIELLTVIVIAGILAAILIPVVGTLRNSAYISKTTSNLRQLQSANLLHANDNKGLFVPPIASADTLGNGATDAKWFNNPIFGKYVYFESLNAASERQRDIIANTAKADANKGEGVTIGIGNGRYVMPMRYALSSADVLSKAPDMVMFADSCNWLVSGNETRNADEEWDDSKSWSNFGWVAFRYRGKACFVHADGHVSVMTKAEAIDPDHYSTYWPTITQTGSGVRQFDPPY